MGRKRPIISTPPEDTVDEEIPTVPIKKKLPTPKVAVKLELEEEYEPDIIPVEQTPTTKPTLRNRDYSSQAHLSSLYASPSSQERFRRAASSSQNICLDNSQSQQQSRLPSPPQFLSQHYTRQATSSALSHLQRPSDPLRPRVIMPQRGRPPTYPYPMLQQSRQRLSHQQSHALSRPIYQQFVNPYSDELTSPVFPDKPSYQDKRIRGLARDSQAVQCPDCMILLKNSVAYETHRNYVHGDVSQISCPESVCKMLCTNMVSLVRHLNTAHRYNLRHEQHVFRNEDEYMVWFKKLVEDGSVCFVQSSCLKTSELYAGTVSLMFYCDNSGRKHLNNRMGTIKRNAVCPAYFRMTKHQSGHVSVYAQLRHVGHDCTPKFKTIQSYQPIRNSLIEIEQSLQAFKALSQTTIPIEYPMERNSLVSSCCDLLKNIKNDIDRARNYIDGIIPIDKLAEDVAEYQSQQHLSI